MSTIARRQFLTTVEFGRGGGPVYPPLQCRKRFTGSRSPRIYEEGRLYRGLSPERERAGKIQTGSRSRL